MELARRGEDLAARYLAERGWLILGRNLRDGRREIDLVIQRQDVVAVVEVKTRRGRRFGHPLEAITPKKRSEVIAAARGVVARLDLRPGMTIRFDAVSVLWHENRPPEILHIPDAWRVG
jgi:putative endonuclease